MLNSMYLNLTFSWQGGLPELGGGVGRGGQGVERGGGAVGQACQGVGEQITENSLSSLFNLELSLTLI